MPGLILRGRIGVAGTRERLLESLAVGLRVGCQKSPRFVGRLTASPQRFPSHLVGRELELELVGDQSEQEMRPLGEVRVHDVKPDRAMPGGFDVAREGLGELRVDAAQPPWGGRINPPEQLPDDRPGPSELGKLGKLAHRLGRGRRQTRQKSEHPGRVPAQQLAACRGKLVHKKEPGEAHHGVRRLRHHLEAMVELGCETLVRHRAEIESQCPPSILFELRPPLVEPASSDPGGEVGCDRLPRSADAPADGRVQPHQKRQQPARRCACMLALSPSSRGRRPQRDRPGIHPAADEGDLDSIAENAEFGEHDREGLHDLLEQHHSAKRRHRDRLVEVIPLPDARRHVDRDRNELRTWPRQGRDGPSLEEPKRAATYRPLDVLGAPEMQLDLTREIADRPCLLRVQGGRHRRSCDRTVLFHNPPLGSGRSGDEALAQPLHRLDDGAVASGDGVGGEGYSGRIRGDHGLDEDRHRAGLSIAAVGPDPISEPRPAAAEHRVGEPGPVDVEDRLELAGERGPLAVLRRA